MLILIIIVCIKDAFHRTGARRSALTRDTAWSCAATSPAIVDWSSICWSRSASNVRKYEPSRGKRRQFTAPHSKEDDADVCAS